jgi:hypothetical protein
LGRTTSILLQFGASRQIDQYDHRPNEVHFKLDLKIAEFARCACAILTAVKNIEQGGNIRICTVASIEVRRSRECS